MTLVKHSDMSFYWEFSLQIFNLSAEDMNFGSYVPLADRKMLAMFEVLSDRLDQMEHGVSINYV